MKGKKIATRNKLSINDKHSNAQEQESCEDTISRQAAIDEIEYELEMINSALDSMTLDFNARERLRQRKGETREILNSIQQLPPVTPQPTRPFRKFTDLSKDEIKQIVTDIFHPKKITNIETHKRDEKITCTIYTEWEGYDDTGNLETDLISDVLTLRNPFEYGDNAIHVDFSVGYDDYLKLKQFCFAKGIFPEDWIKYNPYLQEEKKSTEKQTSLEQKQEKDDSER